MEMASLIKTARERAGLTQMELAARARTSQPTIAAYESGRSMPKVDTLDRLVQACGFSLILEVTPRMRRGALPISIVAQQVKTLLQGADTPTAWRHLVEFADDYRGSGLAAQRTLVSEAPESTGDARFDAAIAGLVEFLSTEGGRPYPGWTTEPSRFVEPWWFVSGLAGFEAMALRDSPTSFARHGVFINEGAFASV